MSSKNRRYVCPCCLRRVLSLAEAHACAPCAGCVAAAIMASGAPEPDLSEEDMARIRREEAATAAFVASR